MIKQWKPYLAGFASAITLVAVLAFVPASASTHVTTNQYEKIAAQFNVTIRWQSTVDCQGDAMGCFDPSTPNIIYVKSGMGADETRYVVLHEIGHVSQQRLALPFNECNADEFARSLGGYRNIGRC